MSPRCGRATHRGTEALQRQGTSITPTGWSNTMLKCTDAATTTGRSWPCASSSTPWRSSTSSPMLTQSRSPLMLPSTFNMIEKERQASELMREELVEVKKKSEKAEAAHAVEYQLLLKRVEATDEG